MRRNTEKEEDRQKRKKALLYPVCTEEESLTCFLFLPPVSEDLLDSG